MDMENSSFIFVIPAAFTYDILSSNNLRMEIPSYSRSSHFNP